MSSPSVLCTKTFTTKTKVTKTKTALKPETDNLSDLNLKSDQSSLRTRMCRTWRLGLGLGLIISTVAPSAPIL